MKKDNKVIIKNTKTVGGWFRFKNIIGSDLILQKPLSNGKNFIPKDGTFEADGSYIGEYGIQLIENLSHYIDNANNKKIKKQEEDDKKQIIIDEANKPLEFFDSDGKKIVGKTIGEVNLTKKELVEYAELKGIRIQSNWSKEKILEEIRNLK